MRPDNDLRVVGPFIVLRLGSRLGAGFCRFSSQTVTRERTTQNCAASQRPTATMGWPLVSSGSLKMKVELFLLDQSIREVESEGSKIEDGVVPVNCRMMVGADQHQVLSTQAKIVALPSTWPGDRTVSFTRGTYLLVPGPGGEYYSHMGRVSERSSRPVRGIRVQMNE